ncbi:MAG TPA: ABC transporter substrate-binding protein [Actinomycetota bacterium]|nr:ABC transporter substrate-binding protein [Actinomycetota bacterium]
MRRTITALVALSLLVFVACSNDAGSETKRELLIAVNAPFSATPYVGLGIQHGVQLAIEQINDAGGIQTDDGTFTFTMKTYDNALSPQRAVDNVKQAISDGAVAIVDEGTGVDASWRIADDASVPICIVYQGGTGLVDIQKRPNVFRIAPTDHGIAFRYAEYLVPKGYKIAILHDDSEYGHQGAEALSDPFGYTPKAVAMNIEIPAGATDYSPQVLQARRSGATAILAWGIAPTIAQLIRDVRGAGSALPIYTPPSGADPTVRQQLADHPEWIDGVTFASGRMTAEVGPGPFLKFEHAYEDMFGRDEVGVSTSSGKKVYQPPEYPMYPYDFTRVLASAIEAAGSAGGDAILHALNEVAIKGANGDERGFNEKNHEGVVDDDVYFALFNDMTYVPVRDDPLSATLDVIPQT